MSNFKWYGDEVLRSIINASDQGGLNAALHLKGESQKEAPIESGDLKGNCSIVTNTANISAAEKGTSLSNPFQDGKIKVGYTLPYAIKQHEDLTLRHDKTDGRWIKDEFGNFQSINMVAGGKAKFLEDPFNRNIQKMQDYVANAVKKVIN
jgi:hypothetical protein